MMLVLGTSLVMEHVIHPLLPYTGAFKFQTLFYMSIVVCSSIAAHFIISVSLLGVLVSKQTRKIFFIHN